MQATTTLERTLTELDHVRLTNLIHRTPDSAPPKALEDLLDNADLVPVREASPDLVTMYSQVLIEDVPGGERHKLTLCYPADAEPASGFVSVLSPVGAALLGQRVGATARWTLPNGAESAAEIVAVLFQPESTGDFTT